MKSIIKTIIIYSILFCSYLSSFALDVEVTNACGGGNSGSINVLLDNAPNGPFTYLWSNGASTSSIENLAAGTYDLTVHDANDCVVTQSMTVEEGILPNFEVVDISCNYIEATATLEISPTLMLDEMSYSYSFDGETPLPLDDYFITAAGLEGGPHSLSIFDEGGCTSMLSIQVPCVLNCFPGVELSIETECEPVPNFMNMLFEFTAVIHYPSEYEGLITYAVLYNEEHPLVLDTPDMLTNPLIFTTFIDSEDFEPYGLIQLGAEGNSDHCIHDLSSLSCYNITDTEEPPNIDVVAPIFLNDTNHTLCYDEGIEICLPYQISDFSPFISVHASAPTLSITKQIIYSYGDPIAEGVFCFTPIDNNSIGTHEVTLTAMDNQPERNIASEIYTIETRCCLSGYDESVTPALVGCNGNTLETGSYTIIPQTSGECTPQADQLLINGNQQNTITNLDAGTHTFDINFEGTIITETVTIPSETTSFDVSYTTENTEGYFTYDAGVGSINLTVSNGFGPFYYDWEDCVAFEGIVVEDSEPELNFCDGLEQYERKNLSAGTYTVTITDEYTGCSVVESITINKTTVVPHQVFTNIFLEGTFNNSNMMTNYLRKNNLLPTKQPYRKAPWNYNGSESVADTSDIPQTAVDWILVEARHEADTTRTIARSAGFLLEDGNIVDTNGETLRLINLLENEKYYIIIRHRNHLAISSRNSITLPNTEGTKYDFTTSITQAKGNSQMRQLPSGKFAMCAGDANADGRIDVKDYNTYLNEASSINDYLPCDFDINTHTTIKDFNLMLNNSGAVGVDWIRYD